MIGIVTAIAREIADFMSSGDFKLAEVSGGVRFFESNLMPHVALAEGGVGRENAEHATELLIERAAPDLIVSAGFAGGVRPDLKPGDLFVCSRVWALSGPPTFWREERAVSQILLDQKTMGALTETLNNIDGGCEWGHCLTVDQFIYNHDLKGWIGETFSVDVIDMESYWVGEIASQRGLPHLVVRTVLDPMDQRLPPFVSEAASNETSRTLVRGAAHILTHPGDIHKLIQVSGQVKLASKRLASVLLAIVTGDTWWPAYQLGIRPG